MAMFPFSDLLSTWKDGVNKALKIKGEVQLTGSNVADAEAIPFRSANIPYTVETVVNAESIPAGQHINFSFTASGEADIWVAVSIDKHPWSLQSESFAYSGQDGSSDSMFPYMKNVAKTFPGLTPMVSLYLGPVILNSVNITTLSEARQYKLPYKSVNRLRIRNQHASETATATVRIIRVWR